jgi:hypothetical protein
MPRTAATLVIDVLGSDYEEGRDLSFALEAAGAIVDDLVAAIAADEQDTLSAPRQALIEKWVAAHIYQQSDPGYTSRSTLDSSGSFKGEKGEGFKSTNYGATALKLDPSGLLDSLSSPQAGGDYLGTPARERQTYEERNW